MQDIDTPPHGPRESYEDVTFNLCLGLDFAGAGLQFCGMTGATDHRKHQMCYKHRKAKPPRRSRVFLLFFSFFFSFLFSFFSFFFLPTVFGPRQVAASWDATSNLQALNGGNPATPRRRDVEAEAI